MNCNKLFSSLAAAALVVVSACSSANEPSAEDVAMRLKRSDRLYVAEYVVHKIVTANDVKRLSGKVLNNDFSIPLSLGDRKIAIPMDAVVKAYIDFSAITPADIKIGEEGRLKVCLPEPKVEMTSSKIDHSGVREYTDMFRSSFSDAEISEFERQGREAIEASIPRLGIERTAKENAKEVLIPIFMQAGFDADKITIEYD